jgi:hypothetical protein
MDKPDRFHLNYLNLFLSSSDMWPFDLVGRDSNVWGSYMEPNYDSPDLVVMKRGMVPDSFSSFIASHMTSMVRKFRPASSAKSKKITLREEMSRDQNLFYNSVAGTSSIVAGFAPTISIIILTAISSLKGRLGTIAALNFLLAVYMTYFTEVKRMTIFTITAAYVSIACTGSWKLAN